MKTLIVTAALMVGTTARADLPPKPGRDYQSLQIASGTRGQLAPLFARHAQLPYLRIERVGGQYALRAGYWSSSAAARAALASGLPAGAKLRIAAYRPERVERRNWQDGADESGFASVAAPILPTPVPRPAPIASVNPILPGQAQNPTRVEPDATADLRPFDDADYRLAFDAFVGAGRLQDAFRLTREAVRQRPRDAEWRRRYARVAEWTQHPEVAATQWQTLFDDGDRSAETVAAVLRLALLTERSDTVLAAWLARLGGQAPNEAQANDIAGLYESAARPLDGARFFETQYRRHGRVDFLERAAKFFTRAGDDDQALRLYRERCTMAPFTVDAALSAVVILVRRDRMREAYDLMQAYRDQVPAQAADYWRILGQLAWELDEAAAAEFAYERFAESPEVTAGDWSRLVFLVRQHSPGPAAELALEAYRRFGGLDNLLLGLGIYAAMGDKGGQARALAALKPEDRAASLRDVRYLVLRGQYRQSRRDEAGAWTDLSNALALEPDNKEVVLPALWFLIDARHKVQIEALLKAWAGRAVEDRDFWLVFASAYHALDRYREALPWYRKEIARNSDDALLLSNYADLLDRLEQPGMAHRVRRHAWLRLRERLGEPKLAPPLDSQPQLLALARLALLDAPGDPGLALVRDLVGRLRGLDVEADAVAQTDDLILAWAIANQQFTNARAWMWLRYARAAGRRPPFWGDSQTALQLNETGILDDLLGHHADGMPLYNRHDAAWALGDRQQALAIAFQGLDDNDVDESVYDRYRLHAPGAANYVQLRLARDRWGLLDSRGAQLEAKLRVDRRLSLRLATDLARQSDTGDAGVAIPHDDRQSAIEVLWRGERGETRLAVLHRRGADAFSGWRFGQAWQWNARLGLNGTIEHGAAATDSLPLRVAGYRDSAAMTVSYGLARREYFNVTPRVSRYYSQFGDHLGDGRSFDAELGYRLRIEYPDWRFRGFASTQHYDRADGIGSRALSALSASARAAVAAGTADATAYYLPVGSTTVGACFGMGENLGGQNLREVYSRGWRHFYDACATHNSVNAGGYTGMVGLAGSVGGEDHLTVALEQARGGAGSGALTRNLWLRYRFYF